MGVNHTGRNTRKSRHLYIFPKEWFDNQHLAIASCNSGSTVCEQCVLAMNIICRHKQTQQCWKFVQWVLRLEVIIVRNVADTIQRRQYLIGLYTSA